MAAVTGRKFLGIGQTGTPPTLVARFEVLPGGQYYYMTMLELCDWIEQQVSSGLYYTSRAAMAVDREALLQLIEAQRKLLAGKKTVANYPQIGAAEAPFAEFALTASGETLRAVSAD